MKYVEKKCVQTIEKRSSSIVLKIMERTKEEKFWMTAHYVIWQNINIVVSYLTSITRKIEQDLARAPLSRTPCSSLCLI